MPQEKPARSATMSQQSWRNVIVISLFALAMAVYAAVCVITYWLTLVSDSLRDDQMYGLAEAFYLSFCAAPLALIAVTGYIARWRHANLVAVVAIVSGGLVLLFFLRFIIRSPFG